MTCQEGSQKNTLNAVTNEDEYLVAFSTVPGIGPARLKLLIKYFGSAKDAWEASEDELASTKLAKDALTQLLEQKKKLNIGSYYQDIINRGIKIITIDDSSYPERLRNIPDPPTILYIKSQLTNSQINQLTLKKIIGVVGTRKVTSYGREVTEQLTTDLVNAGFVIVSGMALGVDGVAHGTAINAGGKTVAVLGAGVEVIYPGSHRELYYSILEHEGAIVSEVAPDKLVSKGIFPARNRIISGLSEAVLVTEGAVDSGSLITARLALEQGREVFAVPGPINSAMNEGTNYLIKNGAKLVTRVGDILEDLGYETSTSTSSSSRRKVKPAGDNDEEQKIIELLYLEPLEFDEIVRKSDINPAKLGSILALLEVKAKIVNSGQKYHL